MLLTTFQVIPFEGLSFAFPDSFARLIVSDNDLADPVLGAEDDMPHSLQAQAERIR